MIPGTKVRRIRRAPASRSARPSLESAGLRLLLQQTPAIVWSTDHLLRVTEVLGEARKSRVLTIQELFTGADEPEATAAHRRALAGESVSLQAIVKGSICTVRLEPLAGAGGEIAGVVGTAIAVDPKFALEHETSEAAQRLFSLVDNLPAAIYTKPVDAPWGHLDTMSPQIAAMLGYSNEQWLEDETLIERVIHPDDHERVRAAGARLRATGEPSSLEYRLIASDGRIVQVHDATVYVRGRDGRADYLHGMLVEAASREAVEEQLRAARSAQVLGRFAGGIVHDFRNSLCAIGGYAALLERELAGTPRLRPWASEIVRASERATDFTSRLIAFSRGETSEPQRIDLRRSVDEFARMYRPLVGMHVAIHVDQPGRPVDVVVDPVELERVLMNLGTNAWDAMPGGGTLTLATETFRDTLGAGWARLTIADTGCGLDEAALGRIFDPFFTTKATGTGLGLATVLEMVRGWGGDITVSSTPGAGTRFEITLPLAGSGRDGEPGGAANGGSEDGQDEGPAAYVLPVDQSALTVPMHWMRGLADGDSVATYA